MGCGTAAAGCAGAAAPRANVPEPRTPGPLILNWIWPLATLPLIDDDTREQLLSNAVASPERSPAGDTRTVSGAAPQTG